MSLREQRILRTGFPGSCFPTSGKTPGANQRTTDSNLHRSCPRDAAQSRPVPRCPGWRIEYVSCQRHRVRPTTLQGRARPPPVGGRRRESGEHNYYTKTQGGSGWAQARGLSTAAAVRVREADKRGVVACIRDAIAVADERMIMHMIAVSCIEWNMSLREQRILHGPALKSTRKQ